MVILLLLIMMLTILLITVDEKVIIIIKNYRLYRKHIKIVKKLNIKPAIIPSGIKDLFNFNPYKFPAKKSPCNPINKLELAIYIYII